MVQQEAMTRFATANKKKHEQTEKERKIRRGQRMKAGIKERRKRRRKQRQNIWKT